MKSDFVRYLSNCGILYYLSCQSTPEHNGLVERKHKHIVETRVTLWVNAFATGVFLVNECQHHYYIIPVLAKNYFLRNRIIISFKLLDVSVFHLFEPIPQKVST